MKRADARQAYYDYTAKASDIARTLALSAIAVIWVLKIDGPSGPVLPDRLLVAGIGAVGALAFDLLHYVVAAALWGVFHRQKEKDAATTEASEFEAPDWINRPTIFLFVAKITLVVATYVVLLVHMADTFGKG